jgi:hypothetical protein
MSIVAVVLSRILSLVVLTVSGLGHRFLPRSTLRLLLGGYLKDNVYREPPVGEPKEEI